MDTPSVPPPLDAVWRRLAPRIGRSAAAGRGLITTLARDMPAVALPGGGVLRTVHTAPAGARRPGTAERWRQIDLPAGGSATVPLWPDWRSEWFVVQGDLQADGTPLGPFDHQVRPAGAAAVSLASGNGARVLVREGGATAAPATHRATAARWVRLGGIGALPIGRVGDEHTWLLRLDGGARLPDHRHRVDEECLLLDGEMFVADRLLRAGDFQVAPAFGLHRGIASEGGALVLVHGEIEPEFIPDDPEER